MSTLGSRRTSIGVGQGHARGWFCARCRISDRASDIALPWGCDLSVAVDDLITELRPFFADRPWILAIDVLQGANGMLAELGRLGAGDCFVVAARRGTGTVPEVPHAVLDRPAMTTMEAIHDGERALRDLPPEVQRQVDDFDPAGAARVLGAIFSNGQPVAGRAFYGGRPAAWQALEDKLVIDAVWDASAVRRAPSQVVPAELEALQRAAACLDRGHGTVWAGDASQGFHGGATSTFPVVDEADAAAAARALAKRCQRARVMPLLPGVPCSIHGIVFDDHVVVLRPTEMVVLWSMGPPRRFVYGRAATFWEPPATAGAEMRAAARRVGEHLRAELGYRGAFTMDGVLTEGGFRPTELNPRVGAALQLQCAEVPFQLLQAVLVQGEALRIDAAALEAVLLAHADQHRRGSIGFTFGAEIVETASHALAWHEGRWREVGDDELADAQARVGPGVSGGYAWLSLDPEHMPATRAAPRAVAFAAWLDERYGASLGPVEIAPS